MSRIALTLLSLSLLGCGDNLPGVADARPGDGGDDSGNGPFTTLAMFNAAMMENPEGVVHVNNVTYAGIAGQGRIVKIATPGTAEMFGTIPAPISNTFTLGLAAATNGDIFVGVGASGANPMPAPGVYRIPAAGGTAVLYASDPMMNFPNAIEVDGTDLYVTDSGAGQIFRVAQNGNVTTWLQDALLAGSMAACGGTGVMFPIGANGIAKHMNNRYVAVTDFGRIVRIPIMGNGNAGAPVVHKESCADLQGADGIAIEPSGSIVVVRNGPSNTMSRISADGSTVTRIHMGAPLDGPASVVLVPGTTPQLIITNSAFFSGATGRPSVVSYRM